MLSECSCYSWFSTDSSSDKTVSFQQRNGLFPSVVIILIKVIRKEFLQAFESHHMCIIGLKTHEMKKLQG